MLYLGAVCERLGVDFVCAGAQYRSREATARGKIAFTFLRHTVEPPSFGTSACGRHITEDENGKRLLDEAPSVISENSQKIAAMIYSDYLLSMLYFPLSSKF